MINNYDQSSRRILTFPAIRPCEAVSPAALLNSLIDLAGKIIDYKSSFFASNKGNARQSIRLIGILLNFLEEVRVRQLGLSDSAVLSLSELHFIFQKIHYLLEDCTRDGARLWMLMRSERVSGQFRVLIRAMATILDVLPLGLIDVSVEVRESIELVMWQARKLKFEVDPFDELSVKNVVSILGQIEDQIVPKSSDLRWVLDYLGVRSWVECDREIKFLDNEIGLEYLTAEKRELGFLNSVMSFMSYCRAVSFDIVGDITGRRSTSRRSGNVVSGLNPDDLRCPISLEYMTEPVTIETGHTYDRSSILQWFRAGNATCPKTGEKLTSTELVPNLALKRLIVEYCSGNGIPVADSGGRKRDITRTVLPGSPVAEAAMKMLANFLVGRLVVGTEEEKKKAAYEVRLLTKSSIFNRSCFLDAGTIPYLLNLLSSKEALAQENAIAALLNMSKHSKGKTIVVENGGLEFILKVLKEGLKMEARQHAAGTLFYLASVEEYRILIGEIPEVIPSLMELLRDGTDRGKKNALVAIFGLLMDPNNHWRVLGAGLVPLLLSLLTSFEREDLITDSLAVLATLAQKSDGTFAILSTGALHTIMGTLSSSTSRAGKEYCVSLLLALCVNGGAEVVQFLVKNSSLMGPLYSVLTEGTSRASKKASSLIRILHEFHERSSSGFMAHALSREQFVHVW
ncbi:U-box domain-containing protein 19-like [Cornus florida]|uniref:U-box domain-containing protein 19-like n=1 Tax=Cornus florida TaxID=4283 RepID=UPI00289CEC16|nr:U-box domain-containing protein 19-like [Cornus florida]